MYNNGYILSDYDPELSDVMVNEQKMGRILTVNVTYLIIAWLFQ